MQYAGLLRSVSRTTTQSEHTESGMLTKSGSVRMSEGKKIVFNLSEDNVFQNRASDVSSGTRRPPTH